ncbi:CvpA family protein [Bartonella tribocorum]|uniref:Colicin V production protein n=1 Tax=Bartonella tribocorum (strain DSM 28219 / CCUG 45778 / CIP 105476 / IBS 506) TaxID=382640 RepID=A9IRS9_BART1|nr:CvpA family protein [Bartonella tribocorum]CAK01218.1 colicin V production protein [Bartonella tribocorum CIP 105476]CDO48435.1 colicin V production protein [Bartonella tribocorum]
MIITILDGIVVVVILLSAFLAMLRGFSREVLSLVSWAIAAVTTLFLFKPVLPFFEQYLSNKMIALITTLVTIFIVVLIITSIITMKISDFIIDSRIGILDRTIGFIFGALRGLLIMVIGMLLINALIKPEHQANWLKDAKTRPILDSLGQKVWEILPKDLGSVLEKVENLFKNSDKHTHKQNSLEKTLLKNGE